MTTNDVTSESVSLKRPREHGKEVEPEKRRALGQTQSDPIIKGSAKGPNDEPRYSVHERPPLEEPRGCPYEANDIPLSARDLRLHIVESGAPKATAACQLLRGLFEEFYPTNLAVSAEKADIIIALGGDGFLLEAIRKNPTVKVYGINCGHLGFLSNKYREKDRMMRLLREVDNAHEVKLPFLQVTVDGSEPHLALNEIVVSRATMQAANLSVCINGQMAIPFLAGDGVLLSTPAGSTAYNLSAGGSILPLEAQLLSLTPICPFRPRRMESVLLDIKDVVVIKSLGGSEKRPVHAAYDGVELPQNAKRIEIRTSDACGTVLLDTTSKHRIFMERFKQA